MRLQFRGFEECGVLFHSHYFQVHSDRSGRNSLVLIYGSNWTSVLSMTSSGEALVLELWGILSTSSLLYSQSGGPVRVYLWVKYSYLIIYYTWNHLTVYTHTHTHTHTHSHIQVLGCWQAEQHKNWNNHIPYIPFVSCEREFHAFKKRKDRKEHNR